MHSIAIYCGSSLGHDEEIVHQAAQLGETLAKNSIRLIYGGASIGLMGTIADSCIQHGGQVIGVMPRFMQKREISHNHLTELHWVDSMHQRKALMVQLADGFIALPGGLGTLDELFETWTWQQLKLHSNPIGLLNINGYFDNLLQFLQQSCHQNFIKNDCLKQLIVDNNPHALLAKMLSTPNINVSDKLENLEKI